MPLSVAVTSTMYCYHLYQLHNYVHPSVTYHHHFMPSMLDDTPTMITTTPSAGPNQNVEANAVVISLAVARKK